MLPCLICTAPDSNRAFRTSVPSCRICSSEKPARRITRTTSSLLKAATSWLLTGTTANPDLLLLVDAQPTTPKNRNGSASHRHRRRTDEGDLRTDLPSFIFCLLSSVICLLTSVILDAISFLEVSSGIALRPSVPLEALQQRVPPIPRAAPSQVPAGP